MARKPNVILEDRNTGKFYPCDSAEEVRNAFRRIRMEAGKPPLSKEDEDLLIWAPRAERKKP